MKLLYVLASFPFSGAKEDFFIPEISQLAKDGNEVFVVPRARPGRLIPQTKALGLDPQLFTPLISIAILKRLMTALLDNPGGVSRLVRIVFQTSGLKNLLKNALMVPKAVWLVHEVRVRGIDHIHAHWATTTSTLAMLTSDMSGIPWSFTLHRGDILANNLLELKLKTASFVRFISESGIRLARERTGIQSDSNWKIIRMGVKPASAWAPAKPLQNFPPVILSPANLLPVKGHGYLLEAVALLRKNGVKTKLLVAGDGPMRRKLEQKVEELSLGDNVEFLGHLLQEDLFALYRSGKVDIVVLASTDLGNGEHEGVPVSLLEAMVYGIPTIATRTGGIPQNLGDGECLLVADKDSAALSAAIARLLQDKALRRSIVLKAEGSIREKFDIEVLSGELEECFRSAVDCRNNG